MCFIFPDDRDAVPFVVSMWGYLSNMATGGLNMLLVGMEEVAIAGHVRTMSTQVRGRRKCGNDLYRRSGDV